MAVVVDGYLVGKANFFRVDPHGNLELYSDPGGLDVSKVAAFAAGTWELVEVVSPYNVEEGEEDAEDA